MMKKIYHADNNQDVNQEGKKELYKIERDFHQV